MTCGGNALWGKTVALQFKSIDGQKIDLRNFRGKVVVLVFYADVSPPSILSLARVEEIARSFPPHSVQCLGVSLDSSAAATRKLLDKFEIDWPVFCDGKGWGKPVGAKLRHQRPAHRVDLRSARPSPRFKCAGKSHRHRAGLDPRAMM